MSATKKLNPRIQGIWSFLMFLDTFRIQKCLETGKRQNPLKSHYFKGLLFLDTFHFQFLAQIATERS